MVTLKQFILESHYSSDEIAGLTEVRNFLHDDAPSYADSKKSGRLFYRGMEGISTLQPIMAGRDDQYQLKVFDMSIRKRTSAVSFNDDYHNAINDWFEEHFGVRPRERGIFISPGNEGFSVAKGYGSTVGAVFTDSTSAGFIWAHDIDDLWAHFMEKLPKGWVTRTTPEDIKRMVELIMMKIDWQYTTDANDVEDGYEVVMVSPKSNSFYFVTCDVNEDGVYRPALNAETFNKALLGE